MNIYPDPLDKEIQRIQHTPSGNYAANSPEILGHRDDQEKRRENYDLEKIEDQE